MKLSKATFLVMVFLLSITSIAQVYAKESSREVMYEQYAEVLKEIGMFRGTGSGFELERQPTRAECAVIIVRLMGKEHEVREKIYTHPFIDVPEWADSYIGYLYHENIANGVGEVKFGSNDIIDANQFFTLLLRVLGYSDKEGDFQWDQSIDKAVEIKLLEEEWADYFNESESTFIRDDVVHYLINIMNIKLKDSETRLLDKLISEEVFTFDELLDEGFYTVLFGKSNTIEEKGIVVKYSSYRKPVIMTFEDGTKFLDYQEFETNETRWITELTVIGEDYREYNIILEKDHQFDPDSIKGKSITFKGDLLVNMTSPFSTKRHVALEECTITGLQNDADYEPIAYKGQFVDYGHCTIGGRASFIFVSENGEKYNAFLGVHNLVDVEKALEGTENLRYSYNLGEYTYQDVFITGFKKKDSNVLIVKDFGKDYFLDEKSTQWLKKGKGELQERPYRMAMNGFELLEIIEDNDENVVFKVYDDIYDSTYHLSFLKKDFEGKVPNEDFIGEKISVYYNYADTGTYSDLQAKKWNYQARGYTSSSYGKLSSIVDETSKYIEFEVISEECLIKKARFYKSDFFNIDFKEYVGKIGYISGEYLYNDLEAIRVFDWISM